MKAHFFIRTLVFSLICFNCKASHLSGKDLEYQFLDTLANGNARYKIAVRIYRNCFDLTTGTPAAPVSSNLLLKLNMPGCSISDTTYMLTLDTGGVCPNRSGCDLTSLCDNVLPVSGCHWIQSGNPPYPGMQVYFYSGTIEVPKGCPFVYLGLTDCCRNPAVTNINNPGSSDCSILAVINNNINPLNQKRYANNSVSFNQLVSTLSCVGSPFVYNPGAVDIDGDSMVFKLTAPLTGATMPYSPVTFNANWSVLSPIRSTGGVMLNEHTGQMTFTPSNTEVDVVAFTVEEYRNGVMVGFTMREIEFTFINCQRSTLSIDTIGKVINGFIHKTDEISVCPNAQLSFSVLCRGKWKGGLKLSSSATSIPQVLPGAVLHAIAIGTTQNDSVLAQFSWTPSESDSGCHYFSLTATDDDCPLKGTNTKTFKVCVQNSVSVMPKQAVYCGTPIQLTASGGANSQWFPTTGLSASNMLNTLATPQQDVTYHYSSDCGTDSVRVIVKPSFSMQVDSDATICQNGFLAINTTIDSQAIPYTVLWTPAQYLYDPNTSLPTDSIINPIAKPLHTTTYTIYCKDRNGCVKTDSLTVNVNGYVPKLKVVANHEKIFSGDSVNLWAIAIPAVSGPSNFNCHDSIHFKQIDFGTSIQGGGGSAYPSPYGNFFKSARHQYLIKAQELKAGGIYGGTLTCLGMQLSVLNSNAMLQNFTISLGVTTQDSLTGFNENLTQVFFPKSVTPYWGWNRHFFDTPFDWDGESNLIVDVCFSSSGVGSINNKMTISTLPYRCTYYTWGNVMSQCGISGTQPSTPIYATFFQRPNFGFIVCNPSIDSNLITWIPNTGANACNPTIGDTTWANPIETTRYTATLNSNGCKSSSSALVKVDSMSRLFISKDTILCAGNPIQLYANIQPYNTIYDSCVFNWISSDTNVIIPSGDSSFSHPIVQPFHSTTYTCIVIKDSVLFSKSVTVTIDSSCLRLFLGNDTTICLGDSVDIFANVYGTPLSGNNFTFNWSSSVGISPPSGVGNNYANPIIKPRVSTVYTCNLVGGWRIISDSITIYIDSICDTMINHLQKQNFGEQFYLYPNPASSAFVLSIPDLQNHTNSKLIISNMLGHKVLEQTIENEETTIYTERLPKGVYSVGLFDRRYFKIAKLVVE